MYRLRRKRDQIIETKSAAGGGIASRTRAATRDQHHQATSIVHKAKEAEKDTTSSKPAVSSTRAKAKVKAKELVTPLARGKENAGVAGSTKASSKGATTAATAATGGRVTVPPRPKLQAVTSAAAKVSEGEGSPRKRKKTETSAKQGAAAGGAAAMSATRGEETKRARCQAQRVPERPSQAALAAAAAAAPTPTPSRAAPTAPLSPRATPIDYALVPLVVSAEQALATFAHWKSTLWFAPSDFNEATEAPTVERTWVPYHEMTAAVEATLIATTSTTTSTSTTPVMKTPPRATTTQQVSCELTGNERIVVCAAQSEEERRRLKNVEDEELLFASESSCTSAGATQHSDESKGVGGRAVRPELSKEGLMRLVDGELRQRLERRGKAEICQHHQVAGVPMKEADIKHLKMDKLRVRIEKDRAVLVPIYTISYYYGTTDGSSSATTTSSSTAGPAKYVFLVNGVTSKCWGERPWGMGTLLSKGIGALGSIFGTDDDDRIGLVEGSHLRRIDGCSHYERDSVYLVFPPSHSYLITSATGWIRLKNSSDAHHVELLSWPRKGERPLGRFTLAPGQEEVFDYRGRWCIEVRDGGGKLTSPIQVVGFDTTDGGGYGNKLCMHYASLF